MATEIFFRKSGTGNPVILLHGFPMSSEVWNEFASVLAKSFTVYTPDLPGFGKSRLVNGDISLARVAEEVNKWVESLGIGSAVVIGHSMGGYVALEMVKSSPSLFAGLGLFHSTAREDSEEKKDSRTKVLRFIEEKGVLAFTSNFIQPLFANQNHPAIPFVKDITTKASKEAVTAYTRAMRDRKDNEHVLSEFAGDVLLIGGDSDKAVPADALKFQAGLNPRASLLILPETGHMGMFEKFEETVQAVESFLRKIYQPDKA